MRFINKNMAVWRKSIDATAWKSKYTEMKIKLTPYKINGEYIVLDIYPTTKEKNQLLNNIKNNCLFSVEEISEKSAVNLSWPWPNPDLKGE
jgi:hypothetical protein